MADRQTAPGDAARTLWTLFEPVHAVTYFAPESRSAFEQAGLRGFWRGYFAGRGAPLGAASAPVVTASFFNFAPAFVARAIPGVWELVTPEQALEIRLDGAVSALRNLLAGRESEVAAAVNLLGRAAGEADCSGRVLAAGNAALLSTDVVDAVLGRLWQAATVLREHRGDGHFAALAAADIDGCEAVVLRCGLNLRKEDLQPMRGWTDEQWDAARARLADRGWLGPDGTLTGTGRAAHAAVEAATDVAASRPWARVGPQFTADAIKVLRPLAQACASIMPSRSPSGVPAPDPGDLRG